MKKFIKSIIANIFGLYSEAELNNRIKYAEIVAVSQERIKQQNDRENIRVLTIEIDIGTTFISVTNEWENPTIGIVLDVEYITAGNCAIAKVYDFVSNQVLYCGNSRIPFSYYNLDAVLKLEPFQRWNLAAKSNIQKDKNKIDENLFSSEEIIELLKDRNFDKINKELQSIRSIKTKDIKSEVLHILKSNGLNLELKE